MNEIAKHPQYEQALRHVRELRGFYTHATVYVLVNIGLFAVNYLTAAGRWWFVYPMLGWGIGLLAHGLSVLAFGRWFGRGWEERKIREYLDRRG